MKQFVKIQIVVFSCILAAGLLGCQQMIPEVRPLAVSNDLRTGEAALRGFLEIQNGCIVFSSGQTNATVLFDQQIELSADKIGIIDTTNGKVVHFGGLLQGSGGFLRENESGWSIMDIEEYYAIDIPSYCPQDRVVRLSGITAN